MIEMNTVPDHKTRKSLRALVTTVVLAIVASTLISGPVGAAPQGPAAAYGPRSNSAQRAATLGYWTRERMRNAKPLPIPRLSSGDAPSRPLGFTHGFSGSARSIRSELPAPEALPRTVDRMPRTLDARAASTTTNGRVALAAAEPVVDPTVYPLSTHGKIFASDPGLGDYVCSATVVPSESDNLVWTAGHCITNEGSWAEQIIFVPAYDNGTAPYGQWVAESFAVHPDWAAYNDFSYDFGALLMAPNAGQEIEFVVGSRGIIFNQAREQFFSAFGYPAAPPFDGETGWSCDSNYMGDDPYHQSLGPTTMAIDCDMTPGSSGGGWIIGSPTDSYLNSVNSYGRPIFEDTMFGPYLGTDADAFWQDMASATPTPPPPPEESVDIHQMYLSLALRGHLVAKGVMSAPDGYTPCTRAAPLGIFRKTPNGWKLLAVKLTNDDSRYKFQLADKTGKYLAYSIDGYVDNLNYCTDSIAVIKVHRH